MGGRWIFLVGCIEIGDNIVNLQAYFTSGRILGLICIKRKTRTHGYPIHPHNIKLNSDICQKNALTILPRSYKYI